MKNQHMAINSWKKSKSEGNPDRRVYHLTSKGVEALKMGLESIVKRKRLFDDLTKFYHEKFEKQKGGDM